MAKKKKNQPEIKTQRMLMTIAFQVEYEAPVHLYEDEDPEKMAAVDTETVNSSPYRALQIFMGRSGARFRAKVKPVFTKGQKAGLEVEE